MKPSHENRAYQQELEDAIFNHWFEHKTNCIAASPGGTGKSFIMAKITKRLLVDEGVRKVLVLAQDGKLLTQNSNELRRYWPDAPIGIYSSGLKMRETSQPVVFAGIQSIYKRAAEFGHVDVILLDEADLLSPTEETMYQRFFNELKEINPNLVMAGLTATPYRLKEGCLTNLDIWDAVAIDLTKTQRFNWFVDNNFLKPLVTKKPGMEIDISQVAMRGQDFSEKELQEVSDTDELNKGIVEECMRFASDRKHWLGFASGVKHGHNLAKIFNSRGIPAVMLSAEDDMDYRLEQEAKFRSGEIRVLLNCGLYSRGWDFPALDCIFWARATQSTSFWIQGCLRGTRTSPGVENCLVLDFVGNIRRLGPVNSPIIPQPRRKGDAVGGEAPLRICDNCMAYVPIQSKSCQECGFIFPPPKTIQKTASSDAIMVSSEPQIEQFECRGVRYQPKVSKMGNAYFSVAYSVFANKFTMAHFIPSKNFQNWWLRCGGQEPIPVSVDEAADRANAELAVPRMIEVDVNKKYPEVTHVEI